MQVALAGETKQGRKLDALPDHMKFVVNQDGGIVGVGLMNAKTVSEVANADVRIIKLDEDKNKAKNVTKAEMPIDAGFEEANKKILDSIYKKQIV